MRNLLYRRLVEVLEHSQVTKAQYESLYGAEIRSKIIGGFLHKYIKNQNKV